MLCESWPVKTPDRELCNLQTCFHGAPILRTHRWMSRTRERRAASDVASTGPERIRSRADSWYAKCSSYRPLLSAPSHSIRQAEYAGVPFVDPQVLNPDVVTHRVTPRTLDDVVAHAKARVMHHNRKSSSQEIEGHSAQRVLLAKSAGGRARSKSRYDIAVSVSEWPGRLRLLCHSPANH
jgi:hypothetical protein